MNRDPPDNVAAESEAVRCDVDGLRDDGPPRGATHPAGEPEPGSCAPLPATTHPHRSGFHPKANLDPDAEALILNPEKSVSEMYFYYADIRS